MKSIDIFSLAALGLDKNRNVNMLKVYVQILCVPGREFACWLAQFLTKKNGLFLLLAQRCTVHTTNQKMENLCLS